MQDLKINTFYTFIKIKLSRITSNIPGKFMPKIYAQLRVELYLRVKARKI